MSRIKALVAGWRGIALVAITYVYFLIFAQFAFLKRLAEIGIAETHLKVVMAAMGAGGILFSLLAGYLRSDIHPSIRLRAALVGCAVAAIVTTLPLGLATSILIAFLIGAALGVLTVTLVTYLRSWLSPSHTLLQVGLGTGVGYFICNFPPLFTASPQVQAMTAAILCCIGNFAASTGEVERTPLPETDFQQFSLGRVLLGFTALVWLDSAAFFIIQSTPALKAGTWQGTTHLWINATLHLGAAVLSAWLLRRRGMHVVLGYAFAVLAAACLLLLNPSRAILASAFYPVGVSLYSVALVAYPALLLRSTSVAERARRAGWIYAIAGWFGSAMGIGMGQNLGHIPPAFVMVAGLAIFAPQIPALFRSRRREIALTTIVLIAALILQTAFTPLLSKPHSTPAIERGRQVYIAEGCISCHSQYVRPNTRDVVMWGPALPLDTLRTEHPPLIGNRRQGPDLSEVGCRRSPLWLRAHFIDPREVSHASFMPSYAHLFQGSTRGDDLIAYLSSLKSPACDEHIVGYQTWLPVPSTANAKEGAQLFNSYCSTCHEASGATRTRWQGDFHHQPPNLTSGPWIHLNIAESNEQRQIQLARIIKFGLPGTDMPGHEYLSDHDVTSIALWLNQSIEQPHTPSVPTPTTGDNQ